MLSPSTARVGRVIKFQQYLKAGVREHWIVDPETKAVQVFILQGSVYTAHMYTDADTLSVAVLDGCEIRLPDVFVEHSV